MPLTPQKTPKQGKDPFPNHRLIHTGKPLFASITADDILAPDHQGYNLVHYAVSYGRQDLLQSFSSLGVNLDAQNPKTKESPLHLACKEGRADMVEFLLTNGANTTIQDKNGSLPIFHAAMTGNTGVIDVFLERDHNALEISNRMGNTVLGHMVLNYQPGAADSFIKYISTKANPNTMIQLKDTVMRIQDYAVNIVKHNEGLLLALKGLERDRTTNALPTLTKQPSQPIGEKAEGADHAGDAEADVAPAGDAKETLITVRSIPRSLNPTVMQREEGAADDNDDDQADAVVDFHRAADGIEAASVVEDEHDEEEEEDHFEVVENQGATVTITVKTTDKDGNTIEKIIKLPSENLWTIWFAQEENFTQLCQNLGKETMVSNVNLGGEDGFAAKWSDGLGE